MYELSWLFQSYRKHPTTAYVRLGKASLNLRYLVEYTQHNVDSFLLEYSPKKFALL